MGWGEGGVSANMLMNMEFLLGVIKCSRVDCGIVAQLCDHTNAIKLIL